MDTKMEKFIKLKNDTWHDYQYKKFVGTKEQGFVTDNGVTIRHHNMFGCCGVYPALEIHIGFKANEQKRREKLSKQIRTLIEEFFKGER